jgi:hypothetical protein
MEIKKLADADFETGMIFEQKLAAAHAAMVAANTAYQAFVEVLRQRYDAPADSWTLTDWADGFVAAGGDSGKRND